METGLKSFLPKLAEHLQTTPASLYEYQRRLVALSLLKQHKGKGPGTGVRLSADNLAALLLGQLFTENPSLVDDRVKWLCKASPIEECAFTAAPTLRGAVARILGMPGPTRRSFHVLLLFRDRLESSLKFQTAVGIGTTSFEAGKNRGELHPITTTRELHHAALMDIAADFQSMTSKTRGG